MREAVAATIPNCAQAVTGQRATGVQRTPHKEGVQRATHIALHTLHLGSLHGVARALRGRCTHTFEPSPAQCGDLAGLLSGNEIIEAAE
jgi:hypothetical protein